MTPLANIYAPLATWHNSSPLRSHICEACVCKQSQR